MDKISFDTVCKYVTFTFVVMVKRQLKKKRDFELRWVCNTSVVFIDDFKCISVKNLSAKIFEINFVVNRSDPSSKDLT
jgi:hypothetical protein